MNRAAAIVTAALLLPACAGGPKVQSDFDPKADFSGWHTYKWAERTDAGKRDKRVYNYVVEGRIRRAVNSALAAKGFVEDSTAAHPDFLVGWLGSLQGQVSFSTFGTYYRYGWGWYNPYATGVYSYQTYTNYTEEGTLLIDLVDAASNQLVWRAMAQGALGNPDRSEQQKQAALDKLVDKMMRDFPPKPGQ